ncbi:EAL domain-containing protein [Baaleninema sp.]|uniref:EAL domain-containing protein n=1 Tax=Baaleninema sp. TaxID=3101197 RepID=UPI003D058453
MKPPISYKLIVLPDSVLTRSLLVQQDFRPVPIAPQFLYRELEGVRGIQIAERLESIPLPSREASQYIVTDRSFQTSNLLFEFLNAQPLSLFRADNPYDWFPSLLEEKSLFFNYQPIFDLELAEIVGHECFARATSATGTCLNGRQLLEAATVTGLTPQFDDLVRTLCLPTIAQFPKYQTFFINVSPVTLVRQPQFLSDTYTLTRELNLPTTNLFFEFSEAELLRQPERVRNAIAQLREWGFGISIDDFRGDLLADRRLQEIYPNAIKFEGEQVRRSRRDRDAYASLSRTIETADNLGIATIAKSLEIPADLTYCRQLGIDFGQGFLLGRPTPTVNS